MSHSRRFPSVNLPVFLPLQRGENGENRMYHPSARPPCAAMTHWHPSARPSCAAMTHSHPSARRAGRTPATLAPLRSAAVSSHDTLAPLRSAGRSDPGDTRPPAHGEILRHGDTGCAPLGGILDPIKRCMPLIFKALCDFKRFAVHPASAVIHPIRQTGKTAGF